MESITDPAVNKWENDEVRPLAEDFERLLIRMRSAKTRYYAEITAKLSGYQLVDRLDLRESKGAPISTRAQTETWMSNMEVVLDVIEVVAEREGILVYPAVRKPV